MLAAFASGTLTCVIVIRPPPGTRLNTSTRVESRTPLFHVDPRQDCTISRFETMARFRPRRWPAWAENVPPTRRLITALASVAAECLRLLRYVSNSASGDARKVTCWWIVLGIAASSQPPPLFYSLPLEAVTL